MAAKAQHLCSLIRRTDRGAIFHSSEQQSQWQPQAAGLHMGGQGQGFVVALSWEILRKSLGVSLSVWIIWQGLRIFG